MSFASLLRHQVTVYRRKQEMDEFDQPIKTEFGHPKLVPVAIGTWKCRIEPRAVGTAREVGLTSNAGAGLSSHTFWGYPRDLIPGDFLVDQDDNVYEIQGVPDDAGGAGHHYEVAADRVTSPDPELTAAIGS